jgi:hypothetical protein
MLNWEVEMEEKWGRAFVHESGHALMAVLQGIACFGVFYDLSTKKFCALISPLPVPSDFSKNHYLFLSAGSAAEKIIYGNPDDEAAKSDRLDFANPGAPQFDETVSEAHAILVEKKRQLKRLVSQLKARMRLADFDVGQLPEVGMDGSDKKFATLLTQQILEDSVRSK